MCSHSKPMEEEALYVIQIFCVAKFVWATIMSVHSSLLLKHTKLLRIKKNLKFKI